MAIFALSAQVIQRSKGHSAVAAAAYRAGDNLHDERLDKTHYYERKQSVVNSAILAPDNSPEWVYDRESLWNRMEAAERQKNGQPAREIVLTLPRELTIAKNWELAQNFVREQFVSKGMIADVNMHNPMASDGKSNPHVHVLLTMRRIENGEPSKKKERQWNRDFTDGGKSTNDKFGGFANTKGKGDGWVNDNKTGLLGLRKGYSDYVNDALASAGKEERVSHLSNKAQGIERRPQPKMGKAWNSKSSEASWLHQHRDSIRFKNELHQRAKKAASVTSHGSTYRARQKSATLSIEERYALDADIQKRMYGDEHSSGGKTWHAEHERLISHERDLEQGQGW